MMLVHRALGALLIPIMALAATSSHTFAASPDITYTTLENGMEVVVIPDRRAPVVSHIVWYKVGAADEPQGKSGIAHFLEHLMFKGTEKIPSGEFSKIIARNGGQDNAFTSQDTTAYFQRVAKDRLPLVMEMEADRMVNLRLTEEDVQTERNVILEERKSRIDNDPASMLSEQMSAVLCLAHPYRIPIIGWEHEMRTLNREDALAFYEKYYAPNNAVLVVAGDVEPEDVIKLAKDTYGNLERSPDIEPRQRVREPDSKAPRRVVLQDERVAKDTLSRHYLTPSYATAEGREAEALELLAVIIGSSSTGRLYQKLVVEEKKAASAGAWYSGNYLDYGRIGFYAVAGEDTPLSEIEASVDAVIEEIKTNGVTADELERARNAQIAEVVYGRDSQFNQARTYGWALVTGRTVADVNARTDRLEAVTREDVQAAASKYLDLKRSVTGELLTDNDTVAASGTVSVPGPSSVIQ